MHLRPSRAIKSSLSGQSQSYDPSMFAHVSLYSHTSVSIAHSSMSISKINFNNYNYASYA